MRLREGITRTLTLLAMIAIIALPVVAQNSKQIAEQKRVIANLEKSIAQEEKQLAKLKKSKASAEQQIVALTRQIEQRNKLISETTRQIKQLTSEVEASERRLRQLGGQLNGLEQSVAEIVRAAYRNYRYHNHLTFLFSAKSFTELTRRIAMLRVATNYRQQQIKQVMATRSDVQAERTLLTKRRAELSQTKRRLDNQRTKLLATVKEAKSSVSKMSSKQQARG